MSFPVMLKDDRRELELRSLHLASTFSVKNRAGETGNSRWRSLYSLLLSIDVYLRQSETADDVFL